MTLEPFAAPTVTPDVAARVCARHGLPPLSVTPMTNVGMNNVIFALGDDVVLRVARNFEPIFESVRKEAVVAPFARRAGVRTPRLLAFDDSRDVLPVPYTLYERAPGETLELVAPAPEGVPDVWRAVGRELARLHAAEPGEEEAALAFEAFEVPTPHDLAQEGRFTAREAEWLSRWLANLDAASEPASPRVCHGDVQASNVMISNGAFSALLDWGSCGVGDPAVDFGGAPLTAAAFMIEGYREVAHDETLEARVLRRHLHLALYLLRRPPMPNQSWAERPLGQFVEVTRFLLGTADARWRALLPPLA